MYNYGGGGGDKKMFEKFREEVSDLKSKLEFSNRVNKKIIYILYINIYIFYLRWWLLGKDMYVWVDLK